MGEVDLAHPAEAQESLEPVGAHMPHVHTHHRRL